MPKQQRKKTVKKVVTVQKTTSKPRRRKRSARKGAVQKWPLISQYIKCLSDPFEFGPVRAGFDTLLPTQLETGYYRGSVMSNSSDGTLIFAVNPAIINSVNFSAQLVASPPIWTSVNLANSSSLNSNADTYRLLSYAVRAFPRIASTAAPGMVAMSLAPKCDAGELNPYYGRAATTHMLDSMAQLHLATSQGTDFYQLTWRPGSIEDFTFKNYDTPIMANNAGTLSLNTGYNWTDSATAHLFMTFTGLPPSTPVYFEVIVHYETTVTYSNIVSITEDDSSPSVASEGSVTSLENAFRSMRDNLPDTATVVNVGKSLFNSPIVRQAASQYLSNSRPMLRIQQHGH